MKINPTYQANWNKDEAANIYHANKDFVNSSSIKSMLKSPQSFLNSFHSIIEPTPAMQFGTLVHTAILEPDVYDNSCVVQPDFGDCRTLANKAKRDDWKNTNAGKLIITQEDFDKIDGIRNAISKHHDAALLLKNGHKERSGYYADPSTGILCKIRPDFYSSDINAIVDLKTTENCESDNFSKTIWNFRYDIQIAMYSTGCTVIDKKAVDHHIFIAVEKSAPFEVAVYVADEKMLEVGIRDYEKSMKKLAKCIETNTWTSYQDNMTEISLPKWAFN